MVCKTHHNTHLDNHFQPANEPVLHYGTPQIDTDIMYVGNIISKPLWIPDLFYFKWTMNKPEQILLKKIKKKWDSWQVFQVMTLCVIKCCD